VKRGEVCWASLDEPRGSEPGYHRPVVVISSDDFNRSKISTVMVAIITSNIRLQDAPGNFLISRKESGLSKESVVNVSQVMTLDKLFLSEKIGELSSRKLMSLNEGLRLSLSL